MVSGQILALDLLEPFGEVEQQIRSLAARPSTLDGVLIALIPDEKAISRHVLDDAARGLGMRFALKGVVTIAGPESQSKGVQGPEAIEAVVQEAAGRCGVAVVAVAD